MIFPWWAWALMIIGALAIIMFIIWIIVIWAMMTENKYSGKGLADAYDGAHYSNYDGGQKNGSRRSR